jgi:hypothetical protein
MQPVFNAPAPGNKTGIRYHNLLRFPPASRQVV